MSWQQHNNAPLLGAQAIIDPSDWAVQFRDGQKLRQEYEGRQQQKALNEIMKVGDHNGRLELAQQHKYAGALVPQLQKYEEDRQKAALDNLKTSADIGKVYGETGKLGAETGEIGVKTQGQTIKNMTDKYSQISAGALTQNPQYFALMLGDFQNAGLINPEQKGTIIDMMMKDPASAAQVMQQLARGTIEGFKATAPEAKVLDGKDAAYMYTVDGFTGEAGQPTQRVAYGQSPDNFATNATSRANNQYTVDAGERNSERSLQGTMYNADTNYQGRIDTANISANTASEKTAVDWYKAQTGAAVAQQNANTAATKAQTVVGADGQPVRKLEANERAKLFEIQEQLNADKTVIQTLDKMMKLVDKSYSGFGANGRAKVASGLGVGGAQADNTIAYDNLATSQALAQLKATFGGAPTEGERKILMDIQASANKTPAQKEQIIVNAFRAVQVRQAYREKFANGIRTGQYLIPTTTPQKKDKPQSKGTSIIGNVLGGK